MASIVNEVIKDVIKEAAVNQIILTPDNYFLLFCEAAKKRGLMTPECNKMQKYLSKLNPVYRDEAVRMNVKSIDELFAFMSSRLNHGKQNDDSKTTQSFVLLAKRLLQSISLLHNKKASELANTSIKTLETQASIENINAIKDKWLSFMTEYDDTYLSQLEPYGVRKNDDLQVILTKLTNTAAAGGNSGSDIDFSSVAELLIASLVPSIASGINDELAEISEQIRTKPELVSQKSTQSQIKNFVLKRVKLDREEFKTKIVILDQILDNIGNQLRYYINKFGGDASFTDIRNDLKSLNASDEYNAVKDKLEKVANSLEDRFKDFVDKLRKSEETINTLKAQIAELKERLSQNVEQSKYDFLTGLFNKRELETSIKNAEALYNRYQTTYSLCFFDIDYFKKVNDTYGHDAGDIILKKVGDIIKGYSRETDVIGRFGGEEFVALLPHTNLEEATIFANKILKGISSFDFIYKSSKFNITISCGIACRNAYSNDKETLEMADKMLYAAKNAGRNCVKY